MSDEKAAASERIQRKPPPGERPRRTLLAPRELANRLGVSLRFVYKHGPALPGYRRLPTPKATLVRFDSEAVEAWIAAAAEPPTLSVLPAAERETHPKPGIA